MVIGFTGTRLGMNAAQQTTLRRVFQLFGLHELHHGAAPGADEQAHILAHELNAYAVLHYSTSIQRGACELRTGDYWRTPLKPLVRNRHIVQCSKRLIAAPFTATAEQRSGTWATVRYAMRSEGRCWLVLRDGNVAYLTRPSSGIGLWHWRIETLENFERQYAMGMI